MSIQIYIFLYTMTIESVIITGWKDQFFEIFLGKFCILRGLNEENKYLINERYIFSGFGR